MAPEPPDPDDGYEPDDIPAEVLEAIARENEAAGRPTEHTQEGLPFSTASERSVIAQALDPYHQEPPLLLGHQPDAIFYLPHHRTIARLIQRGTAEGDPNATEPSAILARLRRSEGDEAADDLEAHLADLATYARLAAASKAAPIDLDHLRRLGARRAAHTALVELRTGHATIDRTRRILDQLTAEQRSGGLAWVDITDTLDNPQDPEKPDTLPMAGGRSLFYSGKTNAIIAGPGVGKSWIGFGACAQAIREGRHAIYLDLEDTERTAVTRMAGLGPSREDLLERFHYVNHEGAWDELDTAQLVNFCQATDVAVVIIDGGAEALARAGVEENDNGAVTKWFSEVPRPLRRLGRR